MLTQPCYNGPMPATESFIDLRTVSVEYQTKGFWHFLTGRRRAATSALHDLTLQLPLGVHFTVFGREGSGKSTLLRLLTGALQPSRGSLAVNGRSPATLQSLSAGYVSLEESEPRQETCYEILTAYAATHKIDQAAARITAINDVVGLNERLHRPAHSLSTAGRLRLNLARAALSHSPLILLDDTAEQLGSTELLRLLAALFAGRTVLVTTRQPAIADQLRLPVLLLHGGTLAHVGTSEEIATTIACPRLIDVWVEGLRYDLLRSLRRHTGVLEARLIPSTQFSGQRLRITLRSSRYLPSLYDLVSQAPLVQVTEIPSSLAEVIRRLT